MSKTIVILGVRINTNLGGPSILKSFLDSHSSINSECEYIYVTPDEKDIVFADDFNMKIVVVKSWGRFLFEKLFGFKDAEYIEINRIFNKADIFLDLWGIVFCDNIGTKSLKSRFIQNLRYMVGRFYKKKYYKYTADFGPIDIPANKKVAKFMLNHFISRLVVRNDVSFNLSNQLVKDKSKIRQTFDTAFMFKGNETEYTNSFKLEKKSQKTIIGLALSDVAINESNNGELYLASIKEALLKTKDKLGHIIVFLIPNELNPGEKDDYYYSDYFTKELRKSGVEAKLVEKTASFLELKQIIGLCDLVLTSRYHTLIASLSQNIPAIAIGWHHKYMEILKEYGFENFNIHVQDLKQRSIYEVIEFILDKRSDIDESLEKNTTRIKESIMSEIKYFDNYLKETK